MFYFFPYKGIWISPTKFLTQKKMTKESFLGFFIFLFKNESTITAGRIMGTIQLMEVLALV